jgi:acetyl esterase/lipase
MPSAEVLSRPARPADVVVRYGSGPDRVADVWLPAPALSPPESVGRAAPLALFLHGGFWRAAYDRRHTGPLAEALADSGFVVCTPEYRKVGQEGGGWPGTFDDVATAVQLLPDLVAKATDGTADPDRVVLGGHSAGGHLALWAASTANRTESAKSRLLGVVSLAGVCDLASCYLQDLGNGAAAELMGGGPSELPDHYAQADPMQLLPARVPTKLVHGRSDDRVPWQQSSWYAAKAELAGDIVECTLLPGCGHFELIDPLSSAWPAVLAAFKETAAGLARR